MNRVKQVIRKFLARNLFFLIDSFYKFYFHFTKINDPLIIILTPGKVGSSSVYKTLIKKFKSVFHIHNFTKKSIERSILKNKKSNRGYAPLHLIKSKHLLSLVKKNNPKIYLICLIREPISREISSIYQNIEMFENTTLNDFLKINNDKVASNLTKLLLRDQYLKELDDWFDEQLFEHFGVDIFKLNLDEGYDIQIFENVSFLLIRMEDLKSHFSEAISEFLPFSNDKIELIKDNIASTKFYNLDYVKLKQKIDVNKFKVCDHYVNNKFVNHFYKNEI